MSESKFLTWSNFLFLGVGESILQCSVLLVNEKLVFIHRGGLKSVTRGMPETRKGFISIVK